LDEVKLKLSARDVEPDFRLIIAFDAEWVEEPDPPEIDGEEPDEDSGPDPTPPRNIILSYQYACRFVLRPGEEPAAECDWSGIIYTRHARRLLSPHLSEEELAKIPERLEFNELLGIAIQDGIKQGKLREWPKAIVAAAHWTRADLASMADYAVIKNQFNAVNKTYVSFSADPYKASFTQKDRHLRKFNVRLMDTPEQDPRRAWRALRAQEIRHRIHGNRRGAGPLQGTHGSLPQGPRRRLRAICHPRRRDQRAAHPENGKIRPR